MKFIFSLVLTLISMGLSTAAQATENQTEPILADNTYKIEFAMNLSKYGDVDRFAIRAINYPGDTFNDDMDSMCRGMLRNEKSEALLLEFKSANNTEAENERLLPVPTIIEFQCLIP